jgi:hypothetical protein
MKITGKRTFTLSQLEKFELLVIAKALNDYYQLEMNEQSDGTLGTLGEVALRILNQINDYRDSQ